MNIMEWAKERATMRKLRKSFHITLFDGPEPGRVSFSVENVKKGVCVALPPGMEKGLRVPVTDPFVYQLAVNGLIAVGSRIREVHAKCSQETDVAKKCDVCRLSLDIEGVLRGLAQKKAEARAKEIPIPLSKEKSKIILPNGTENRKP
jgi:hypothetical protein